ncbi:hypothetical protein ACHAXT_009071 [Thalassiosira profunda]
MPASMGTFPRRRRRPGLLLPLAGALFLLSLSDHMHMPCVLASSAASTPSPPVRPPPAGAAVGGQLDDGGEGALNNPLTEGGSGDIHIDEGSVATSDAPINNEGTPVAPAEGATDVALPPQQNVGAPLIDDAAAAMASAAFGGYEIGQGRPAVRTSAAPPANKQTNQGNSGGGGGWFGKILGGNKQNEQNTQTAAAPQRAGPGTLPPPPPPPPPANGKAGGAVKSTPWRGQQQQPGGNYYPNNNQYGYDNNGYADPNAAYQNLLLELDESTLREMTMTHQIHNLTAHISTLTSESDTLVAKIDVLTERLADSESNWNFVHNRNLELDANCTALTKLVAELQEQVNSYEGRVGELQGAKGEDESNIQELRAELRKATDELEKLACLVETERFEAEKSTYLEELKRKQAQKRKKKRGFWAWLFGWDGNAKGSKDLMDGEATERHRAAQELARSTLLHALQTERSNVEELESAVATLQRNNSAIVDVVSSRDSLITELNDRVAVFEDDKMVLKAALRQLQLEMKEEAPKTQQLVDDLDAAREREEQLRGEMEELMLDQEAEREEWEGKMAEMTQEQNATQEELDLISLYVDQLEDRLANFAIARKELDVREKEVARLETEAKQYEEEAGAHKAAVDELERESGETKALLDDLVKERADTRIKIGGLNAEIDEWKKRLDEAERRNAETKSVAARQLFLRVEEEKAAWNENAARQLEEDKRVWQTQKEQELRQLLEHERANWESQSAQEMAVRLGREQSTLTEEFEGRLQQQKAELEGSLGQEWSAKLDQQRMEMESQYQDDLQGRIEDARAAWEEAKERELSQRLEEERTLWESRVEAARKENNGLPSAALEGEVERAAAKVYARLEDSGFSFGSETGEASPPVDPALKKLLFGGEADSETQTMDEGSETEDMSEEAPDDMYDKRPLPEQRDVAPKRSVPFRAMRKAFSRATGLHGLITPSTVQLRQREMRKRQKGKPRPRTSGYSKRNDDEEDNKGVEDANDSGAMVPEDGEDASNVAADGSSQAAMNGDSEGGMSSHPASGYSEQRYEDGAGQWGEDMASNDAWGSQHASAVDGLDAEGFASSSWGAGPAGEGGNLPEPPPLPEMDDPLFRG